MAEDNKEYTETHQGQSTAFPMPPGLSTESEMGDSDEEYTETYQKQGPSFPTPSDMASESEIEDRERAEIEFAASLHETLLGSFGKVLNEARNPFSPTFPELLTKSGKVKYGEVDDMIKDVKESLAKELKNVKQDAETLKKEAVKELVAKTNHINNNPRIAAGWQSVSSLQEEYWEEQVHRIEALKGILDDHQIQIDNRLKEIVSKRKRSFFFRVFLYFEGKRVEEQKQKVEGKIEEVAKIIKDMEEPKSYREKRIEALKSVTTKNLIEADSTLDIEKYEDLLTEQGTVNNDKIRDTTAGIIKILKKKDKQFHTTIEGIQHELNNSLNNSEALEIHDPSSYHKEQVKFWERKIENFELQTRVATLDLRRMQATAAIAGNAKLSTEERVAQINRAKDVKKLDSLLQKMRERLSHHENRIRAMKTVTLESLNINTTILFPDRQYKKATSKKGELDENAIKNIVTEIENDTKRDNTERIAELRKIVTASLLLDKIKQGNGASQSDIMKNKIKNKKALLGRIVTLGKNAEILSNANSRKGRSVFKKIFARRKNSGGVASTTRSSNTSKGVKKTTRTRFKMF